MARPRVTTGGSYSRILRLSLVTDNRISTSIGRKKKTMCCTMYHAPSTMYHESRCTMDHGPRTIEHVLCTLYHVPTHPPTHSPTHLQPTTLPLTSPQQPSKPQASNMEPFRVRYSYRTPSIPMDPSGGCPSLQVTRYFSPVEPPSFAPSNHVWS